MIRAVIIPLARLADLDVGERRVLRRRLTRLGTPLVERSGVVARRIAFVHDFYQDDVDDLRDLAQVLGMTLVQLLEPNIPDNWRYPVPLGRAFATPSSVSETPSRRAASAPSAAKPRAVRPAKVSTSPSGTSSERGSANGRKRK